MNQTARQDRIAWYERANCPQSTIPVLSRFNGAMLAHESAGDGRKRKRGVWALGCSCEATQPKQQGRAIATETEQFNQSSRSRITLFGEAQRLHRQRGGVATGSTRKTHKRRSQP
eukprot:m.80250 g.80250  ORF g.80250 m.80250 type:complete len:115 (-) comp10887_c1_seq1:1364-1708(-)